jgi:hypothetical protein
LINRGCTTGKIRLVQPLLRRQYRSGKPSPSFTGVLLILRINQATFKTNWK